MNSLQIHVQEFMKELGWKYWDQKDIIKKLEEELSEVKVEVELDNFEKMKEETGDLLFAVACHCNKNNLDMDELLKQSTSKFRIRDKNRY